MTLSDIFRDIRKAIETSPRNGYVAELHLQVIKHSHLFGNMTGREFCEGVGIPESFGTEFSKMRKIATRLTDAGLDTSRI